MHQSSAEVEQPVAKPRLGLSGMDLYHSPVSAPSETRLVDHLHAARRGLRAPQSNPGTLQHALFAGIAFAVGCLTRLFRASRSWKCAFGVLERNERFVYKLLVYS